MKLTKEQVAAYVDGDGLVCPFCGGAIGDGGSVDIEPGCAFQEMTCADCGETWTDVYWLHHIFQMED